MEAYRSGHNEPDSKSGCPHGHVSSNLTASAMSLFAVNVRNRLFLFCSFLRSLSANVIKIKRANEGNAAESEGRNALCREIYGRKGERDSANRQTGSLPNGRASEGRIKPAYIGN